MPSSFRFGAFELDPQRRVLTRDGVQIDLRPKAFALLHVLVSNHDRVVGKAEILERVWPDGTGTEANITVNVAAVRRALGEDPREHRYVLTVPTVGYRFIAAVNDASDPVRVSLARCRHFGIVDLVRVANGDPGVRTGDGRLERNVVAELVAGLNALSHVHAQHLDHVGLSGESARSCPTPATSVDAVVVGTIEVLHGEFCVEIAIFTLRDGRRAWSGRIVHPRRDASSLPLRLQRLVLGAVRSALAADRMVTSPRPVVAISARENLQHARSRLASEWSDHGLRAAADLFDRVVGVEPAHASAHAGLAEALILAWAHGEGGSDGLLARARRHAARALEIDPLAPEAHGAMGQICMHVDRDWGRAREHFLAGVDFAPHDAAAIDRYGRFLAARRQVEAALHTAQRAHELDPGALRTQIHVALTHAYHDDLTATLALLADVQRRHHDPGAVLEIELRCRLGLGDLEGALRLVDAAGPELRQRLESSALEIATLARAGERERAEALWEDRRLRHGEPAPLTAALVDLYRGDSDAAIRTIDDVADQRRGSVAFLDVDPIWRPLHGHPEWPGLTDRVFGRSGTGPVRV